MQSTTPTPHRVHFDSDSYDILVDNCCSKSITNCLDDFLEPPRPSNLLIKGFNGATATTKVGTVQWPLQDDEGRVHKITLPHTYYSKHAEHRLLSPQHWAQVANQGRGTRCITYHDSILLTHHCWINLPNLPKHHHLRVNHLLKRLSHVLQERCSIMPDKGMTQPDTVPQL